jgi:hypothetical protein
MICPSLQRQRRSRKGRLVPIRLPTQPTPPMRRPIKGGRKEPAACIDAPADSLRAMQAISEGLRNASAAMAEAAVWRSGRPNLREVRPQARAAPETSAPATQARAAPETSAPAISRKMPASSPIEKPMVATNSPMATNETGGHFAGNLLAFFALSAVPRGLLWDSLRKKARK